MSLVSNYLSLLQNRFSIINRSQAASMDGAVGLNVAMMSGISGKRDASAGSPSAIRTIGFLVSTRSFINDSCAGFFHALQEQKIRISASFA